MLDTLRRNVRRLSWTLWLVIAAFIILYIPDLVGGGGGNVVARVDGDPIMAADFRQALSDQVSYYRQMNPGQLPDDLVGQLQLDRVVLEQLVRRHLLVAAAEDQGFAIPPQEIKDRIMQFPVFRNAEGRWVGDADYIQILRNNGLEPSEFERSIVEDLLVERITGLITEGVAVSDAELQEAYQRQNEKVRIRFVEVRPTAYEDEVRDDIDDAALRAHYEADPSAYRLPEQRQVSYALIDTEAIRDSTRIDQEELRAEYEASIAEYTIDEQIKARQILFRVPPAAGEEEKAAIRAEAEAALERVRAGEDFAALAEELSDDPSAAAGGDLGWVTRGRQVEGFDEAAFALEPGESSDVVETSFGFHIIQVEDTREQQVQPFEEVRGQLEQRFAWERAEARAEEMAGEIRRQVLSGNALETIASEHGLTVQQSPLFTQDSGFDGFTSSQFTERAFSLGEGRVGEPVRVRRGFLVFRVDEIVAPHTPGFEAVRDAVLEDVVQERARERARAVAAEYTGRLAEDADLAAIAEEAETVVDESDLIDRDGFVPALGRSPELIEAAFALDAGQAGGPVRVQDRFVIFQVAEHVQPDWSLFAEQREQLRSQELSERRNRLFEAFVGALREEYPVRVYEDVLAQAAGQGGVDSHAGHDH